MIWDSNTGTLLKNLKNKSEQIIYESLSIDCMKIVKIKDNIAIIWDEKIGV